MNKYLTEEQVWGRADKAIQKLMDQNLARAVFTERIPGALEFLARAEQERLVLYENQRGAVRERPPVLVSFVGQVIDRSGRPKDFYLLPGLE